jgi:hypothetical protein
MKEKNPYEIQKKNSIVDFIENEPSMKKPQTPKPNPRPRADRKIKKP